MSHAVQTYVIQYRHVARTHVWHERMSGTVQTCGTHACVVGCTRGRKVLEMESRTGDGFRDGFSHGLWDGFSDGFRTDFGRIFFVCTIPA